MEKKRREEGEFRITLQFHGILQLWDVKCVIMKEVEIIAQLFGVRREQAQW